MSFLLFQVNGAFSVEKGDSGLSFTTRDRVTEEEVWLAASRNGCVLPRLEMWKSALDFLTWR